MAEILAEVMIDVKQPLLVACSFEHFLCAGRRREKTVGGLRQGAVALHKREGEKRGFGDLGDFGRIACYVLCA